ncbi:WD40/YVTN repeat-like-containing domain protein [Ophiocordyceps sinensis CO18]|uniref:WD40/YVTN repeat-like-containing domain protein n=1 Tax=Ophiocordyceps sinensis (strain Co18 / CGMCC 3.14243) TaxID=911162 RepID=T5ABY6_OPHSC|nr:WD40/YVTN repeat-like-containing domain protein [Ophiocordyceps sinensis CO18]
MKTRRGNRTKSYTIEKYDFEISEGDAHAEPPRRKAAAEEERDANFDDVSAANNDEARHDEEADRNEGLPGPDADAEMVVEVEAEQQPPATANPSRRRARKPSSKADVAAAGPVAYRELEPVPSDSHAVKSYIGPYDRCLRGQSLISIWFGPHRDDVQTIQRLLDRWVLILTESAALPYVLPKRPLPVLLGPYPAQRVVTFLPGDAYCLSLAGVPFDQGDSDNNQAVDQDDSDSEQEDDSRRPMGWMLDTGGIVVGMDWAPRAQQDLLQSQLLALAVIPHADHETFDYETEHQKPDFQRHGIVQLWAFDGERLANGIIRPSTRRPTLRRRLCFDCGRARRVKWSPTGGHLAVICGHGSVRVLEIGDQDTDGAYEKIEQPLAILALKDEDGVNATCMAWATYNRLVVGYSDGSLALWSIYPARLLGRHPVHHSDVVDVATAAPTMPYLVASSPIGGSVKLVDVRSPGCETTEVQINAVNIQPNMLAWSDHVLGFFSAYPSANALNTMVGFMHHRHFPIVRRIFTGDCFLSCLAVGRTHPHLLVGTSDGSLWSLNPQCELFRARRPAQDRIRIFQHEHRPPGLMPRDSPAPARGAARVLHGFAVEKNVHAVPDRTPGAKKPARKGRKRGDGYGDDDDDEPGGGGDEPFSLMDPTRGILHEPLTRVTTVEWNPNPGFGCWAAAAMGSGLVRVLDLGLENENIH